MKYNLIENKLLLSSLLLLAVGMTGCGGGQSADVQLFSQFAEETFRQPENSIPTEVQNTRFIFDASESDAQFDMLVSNN